MIHECDHLSIRDGTFRSYGQGLGKLRPARGNDRIFTIFDASLAASMHGNRVVSTRNTACFTHAMGDPNPQQPLPRTKQQTQNAYHFAEASKLR